MSENVILESRNAKLYKDRFIYKNNETYAIGNIKKASVDNGGFFSLPALEIEFKNGETKYFVVGSISTASMLNGLFSDFMVDTGSQELKAAAQQYAGTINMLIALNPTPKDSTDLNKQEKQTTTLNDYTPAMQLQKKLEETYRLKVPLYPLQVLELDIKEKIELGKTREQAITELYEENQKKG
jgi:hypothetical protein